MTCQVCERTEPTHEHRCRFERGCLCWHGWACGRESRGADSWKRTARIFDAAAAAARKA